MSLKNEYYIEHTMEAGRIHTTLYSLKNLQPVFTYAGKYSLPDTYQLWTQVGISSFVPITDFLHLDDKDYWEELE